MKLAMFDPPGFLDDFNQEQKVAWSQWISERIDEATQGRPDVFDFDGPRAQFYNPMKVDTDAHAQTADITWTGFPRNVMLNSASDLQRWRAADTSRDVQDEYCEWSVERNPQSNKITRVTFTCEGPEYWTFLANTTPEVALDLYRRFVSPNVELEHLFNNDGYNPRNRWNASTINGAMHLIQANNTLNAEIELAGGSSVVRMVNGRLLNGAQELIRCGRYGDANRNSDPHIGEVVNSLTRQQADVTLANPIGLYFADLLTAGWEAPDGSDPKSYWSYVRGIDNKPVRAVYEVPADRGFTVGDITINGATIDFGAQIADFVNIKLTGVATRFGQSTVQPMSSCRVRRLVLSGAFAAPFSVSDMLVRNGFTTR